MKSMSSCSRDITIKAKNHGIFIIYILVALWRLPWPIVFPKAGLDPSWNLGMNLAFLEKLQFGKDVAFTYGVLGFLNKPLLSDYDLWRWALLFSLFVTFFYIMSVYLFIRTLSAKWYYYILAIPPMLFIFPYENSNPPLLLFGIAVCIYALILRNKPDCITSLGLIGMGSLLSIASLIKFNMLFVSVYIILISIFALVLRNGQVKQVFYFVISYIASFMIIWSISGQDFQNIASYLYNGAEISTGYSEAMAASGASWQIYLAFLSIFILAIIFIYFVHTHNKDMLLFFILNFLTLFTSFKLGFVRQDDGHVLTFLNIFLIFSELILIVLFQNWEKDEGNNWMYSVIILNVIILFMLILSTNIIAPWILHQEIDANLPSYELSANMLNNRTLFEEQLMTAEEKVRRDYPMDQKIIRYIDGDTIDIFPWDIALCWAYGLNWSPRPVFQSYSAYTKHLDDINSQHFASQEAPQTILYAFKSIDGRYPLFDEPATFRAILQNYKYENSSSDFLLLSHSNRKMEQKTEVDLGIIDSRLNTFIPVPKYNKGFVFGILELNHSIWGKIISTFYKPSPVYIQFKLDDGSVSEKFRLIPDNARNGLFLSEYVDETNGLASIFGNKRISNNIINGIYIKTDSPVQYTDSIEIRFRGVPANISANSSDKNILNLIHLFKSENLTNNENIPIRTGSVTVSGESRGIIFQHPLPSIDRSISFENITIGNNAELKFGLALDPEVWSPDKGDGVTFDVYIDNGKTSQKIFSRYIDPKNNISERKWNYFSVNLSSFRNSEVKIILKTSGGPKNDCSYDWAYWGNPMLINS